MSEGATGFGGEIPVSSNFLFEVDGVQIGSFKEVHGLELRVEIQTYEEGGENGFVHQLPSRMSWPNIVLKRGVVQTDALFDWVRKSSGADFATAGNKLTRCTGAIVLMSSSNQRLRSYELQGAFPVRWTGPRLNVDALEPLVEELEVAHHGFVSKTNSQAQGGPAAGGAPAGGAGTPAGPRTS
jgi:phage tail-like protein